MKFIESTLFIFMLCCPPVWAQTPPAEAPGARFAPRMEQILKNSLQINRESEGIVFVEVGKFSYQQDAKMMFMRKRGARLRLIATGKVGPEQVNSQTGKTELLIVVDQDSIIQYPQAGDIVVPLAEPGSDVLGEQKESIDIPAPVEDEEEDSREVVGYLEFGIGKMNGSLSANNSPVTTNNIEVQANDSKINSGYQLGVTHFAYYSSLIPLGIEYDKHGGDFPTRNTFYSTNFESKETVSTLALGYRFKKIFSNHLEVMLKAQTLSDEFTTTNIDEHIISTKTSGLGFGTRLTYELKSPVWEKRPDDFLIQLQNVYAEAIYHPSLTVEDSGLSRGTSGSASGLQYRIGATGLFWLDFVPIVKRWFIQASYGARSYSMKFSGPTTSQGGVNSAVIGENTTATESESDYRVLLGIRFEDPLGMLKKKKKK